MSKLLIRVDAGADIGLGHVMRCLALAQGWQEQGGKVLLVSQTLPAWTRLLLITTGIKTLELGVEARTRADAEATKQLALEHDAVWVVVDGYGFESAYQAALRNNGYGVLVLDDLGHLDQYHADIIVNQNLGATPEIYHRKLGNARVLAGTRYVLLRREFLMSKCAESQEPIVASRILVTLGGSDLADQALKVLHGLNSAELDSTTRIRLVLGHISKAGRDLSRETTNIRWPLEIVRGSVDMVGHMEWADVAITGAGSTCWELAFMGVPAITLVFAENQRSIASNLQALGAVENLRWYSNVSAGAIAEAVEHLNRDLARRRDMSQRGRLLVDGHGVTRVIDAMNSGPPKSISKKDLKFRTATWPDAILLWQWANDELVRANSFEKGGIEIEDHIEWYDRKLRSPDVAFWIVERDSVPVGQIRYEKRDRQTAEISFSVAREYRGQHVGTTMLGMTAAEACRRLGVSTVRGVIIAHNEASIRAFERSGFVHSHNEIIDGRSCNVFKYEQGM